MILDHFHPMFFETLQRHLAVCGQPQLPAWLRNDPNFWHIISIRESYRPMPEYRFAKRHMTIYFEDREELEKDGSGFCARPQHMRRAFEFADEQPNSPLLIHCWAGRSRSTAVALALLVRGLFHANIRHGDWVQQAADQLLEIRPVARPNFLVLRLGLEQFLPAEEAMTLATELVNEPRLLANRFIPD